VRANEQRDLRTVLQDMPHDAFVRLARVIADGVEGQHGTKALDDRRLAGAAPADEHVEIGVEVNGSAVEKAPFPSERNELRVLFPLKLALLRIESDAGARIEEGLPQPLDAEFGHLDPAGG